MDPEYKVKYEKYKMTVKIWEHEFKKKNNSRIPSKYDIKEAPLHVKQAYKMYYRMKTSFLENTLNDVLDADEDFSQSESFSQQLTHDDSVLSTSIQELLDTKNSLPSAAEIRHFGNLEEIREKNISIASSLSDQEKGIVKNFEPEEKLPLNENAWGSHLNKKKPKKEPPKVEMEKVPSKLKLNISQSEMKSLRNPRKSLSRNLSKPRENSIEESRKEVLPDLETLLLQKSRSGNDIKPQIPLMPTAKSEVTHFVDQGWLDRNTSDTVEENNKSIDSNNEDLGSLKTARDTSSFGLSGLNLKSATSLSSFDNSFKTENKYHTIDGSDDEVVENSEDEATVTTRKILHIAKKRKILEETNQNANKKMNVMEKSRSLQNVDNIPETSETVLKKSDSISHESILKPNEPKIYENQEVKNKPPVSETGESSTEKDPPVKPKRKFKSNPNTTASKKSITPEKVPTRERIPRQSSMRIDFKEKLDEEEDGDFDGDDSDKDPDFGHKPQDIPEPIEDLPILKRKKSIIKKSKENLEKITKKATEMLKGRKTEKKAESGESDKEPGQEKPEFVNYLIDSNLKKIKTLPRVNIKEIQKSEVAFEKYVKSHNQGSTVAGKSVPDVNVKSQMAREKLEKRVASGTLNENYVRVNMKKKVFVRGKKVFNFSRYKKALWKGKKAAAALSGPDMDMGGCDGGVLKCFNCGGVGHFAQDCKQKGDNLLPLDAEMVDESPFLTLEEAAGMANDKKMVVHYRNPDNIPEVRNEAWKSNEDKNENDESLEEDSHEINENVEMENNEVTQKTPEPKISYIGHKIPDDFLKKSGILELSVGNNDTVQPLYSLNEDNTVMPTTREVFAALRDFGHENFRPGQEKAIMRILSGVSTLVTLSTGSGKSLCYQLPAYLYKKHKNCITLVISPLVSLMEDQVHGVPSFLNAQCLHTNQTPKQRQKTMDAIKAGKVDILLVSPEAVVSGEKSTGFGALLRQLPPIAFACIDEAHCVSQWSHNFRPSYLMICRVLKEKLGVKTVLGLTATATLQTRTSIVRHLGIPDGLNGIISDIPLPDNLILTVSKDENRDRALIGLLKSERFASLKSIIIYCTRRDECTRIAGFIRTCLQDEKNENLEATQNSKKRKRINWNAEVYHAGLPASQRRTIQNAFMSGDVRIVVATIAFGMGINKADIRGIIHYNMPKNFESYVQEVGRAGRDGLPAHCHLFLDSKGQDMSELRRHIYADSIDRHAMRKLLQKVFVPCACKQNIKNEEFRKEIEAANAIEWDDDMDVDHVGDESSVKPTKRICPGHEVCFSVEGTVQLLDLPEENVSTLLCYLELHEQRYIQVLGNAYTICKVMSYGGPKYLKQIAKTCPPLAMAIALDLKNGIDHENSSTIEFNVVDIAAAIGWDSGVVKYQLKQLEWTTVNGQNKRSALSVEFSDLGFRIKAPGDLTDEELDSCLDLLQNRCSSQEKAQLIQLQFIFDALSSVSFPFYHSCCNEDVPKEPSEKLKSTIRQYFQSNDLSTDVKLVEDIDDTSDQEIISDIRSMMSMYPENNFTGRALARIFHGISSPCYQAVTWGRCKYWRAHTKVSFYRIIKLANREILKMKS